MILCERSDTNCIEFKFVSNKEAIGRYWKNILWKAVFIMTIARAVTKYHLGLSDFSSTL